MILVVLGLLLAGWVAFVTFKPIGTDRLVSVAAPTEGPEIALARWAEVQARDDGTIDPRWRSWSLLHDEPVETTVVLLHGYTNCPFMFRWLGNELFDRGWNVIAPRFPYHGYVDRLSEDQGLLTAEDLIATADEAIDISAGGVTAAWVAQNRPDVDRVVGLAPMMNLRPIPGWFAPPTSRSGGTSASKRPSRPITAIPSSPRMPSRSSCVWVWPRSSSPGCLRRPQRASC